MTAFFPWTGAKGPTEKRDVCGISAHKYNPLMVYSRVLFWPNTLYLLCSPAPRQSQPSWKGQGQGQWVKAGVGRRDTHGPGGAARATQANLCHKSPLGTCQWAGHQSQGGDTQRGVQCRTVQVAAHGRGAGGAHGLERGGGRGGQGGGPAEK